MSWAEVWAKRSSRLELSEGSNYSLRNLIDLNGYDSGGGSTSTENGWRENAELIRTHLGAQKGNSLLDLGCGSGALMRALGDDLRFTGLDYSPDLLQVARMAVPSGTFQLWDFDKSGGRLPPPEGAVEPYDFVVIHGVLHYLEENNAREVVRESLRTAGRGVFVGEIPRFELREDSEALRNSRLPRGSYRHNYEGLKHTFFREEFFREILDEAEFLSMWRVRVFPESLLESAQQGLRFAVSFERQG